VTDKTPEEILAAIDRGLEETAARLDRARPKSRLHPAPSAQSATPRKPKTPEEIIDAIERALHEIRRRLAEAEAGIIDRDLGTADGN
jgi:hypothetical protein